MQGTRFAISYHTAGTLAANHTFTFNLPFDAQLIAVSAAGSNANNGILDIGLTGALEAYLKDMDVGDSDVAAIKKLNTDFVGSEFPHIPAATNVIASLDYDGGAGTAVHDFTLVMYFTEG